jgi:hypothetical protein
VLLRKVLAHPCPPLWSKCSAAPSARCSIKQRLERVTRKLTHRWYAPLPHLSRVDIGDHGGVPEQVLETTKAWRLRPRQRAWLVVIAHARTEWPPPSGEIPRSSTPRARPPRPRPDHGRLCHPVILPVPKEYAQISYRGRYLLWVSIYSFLLSRRNTSKRFWRNVIELVRIRREVP